MDQTVTAARELVNTEENLIIVTADHSDVIALNKIKTRPLAFG